MFSEKMPIYNCSSYGKWEMTNGTVIQFGREITSEIPFENMVWPPGGHFTKCKYYSFIKVGPLF